MWWPEWTRRCHGKSGAAISGLTTLLSPTRKTKNIRNSDTKAWETYFPVLWQVHKKGCSLLGLLMREERDEIEADMQRFQNWSLIKCFTQADWVQHFSLELCSPEPFQSPSKLQAAEIIFFPFPPSPIIYFNSFRWNWAFSMIQNSVGSKTSCIDLIARLFTWIVQKLQIQLFCLSTC